jgi:hypothetical protein
MQARSATEVRPFIVLPFGSPRDISAAKGQNQVNEANPTLAIAA